VGLPKTPNAQDAARHFDQYFGRLEKKAHPRPLQVGVFSQKLGLDYRFGRDSADRPYHTASIGKVFTAALIYMLAERGLLEVKAPVARYLEPAALERLFVFQNVDYAGQVTVEQLIGHTSGIADYFEGKAAGRQPFAKDILKNPQFHWTPQALVDFSRNHQATAGIPGKVFNYSDTGYILLGLLAEQVTGKSFAQNLADEFFVPLEMRDS
jgi:D-alanyl-D-alanine carboxypeptidase